MRSCLVEGRFLIVIAGPIGAGKSTAAAAIGKRLVDEGIAAAVVDLDDVAFMQRGDVGVDEFWRRGATATCALIRSWFDSGCELVVTHGPFFESGGYALLREAMPRDVATVHVLLRVPVSVALQRVEKDSTRGLSRDPAFLRSTHLRFAELEHTLPPPHVVIDTAEVDVDAVVTGVIDALATVAR